MPDDSFSERNGIRELPSGTVTAISREKSVGVTIDPEDVNRRDLLRITTVAGALLALDAAESPPEWERIDYFASGGSLLDSQVIEEYAALNEHLWRVFVLARTKSVVFPLVRDQLDVLISSLGRVRGQDAYERLCRAASSLFQLAGEILFDGNRYTDAAHCYSLAATAGREARMPDMWACALTRHAFIGVYEREFDKSAPMLALAARLARQGDQTLSTRCWVAAVQAQAFAGQGDLASCQQALDAAGQVHDLAGDYQNGGWLRFDGSRLPEERGACYVRLQRADLAEAALADALGADLSPRRRGGVLADLAMLGAQRNDLDQVVTYADPAIQVARETQSGVIARKLSVLQSAIMPFLDDDRVRDLRDRIAALSEL